MAMIPQVDISVTLIDTGYALPIVTEMDGSSTFGQFGLTGVSPGASGVTLGGVKNVARFPAYNSNFGSVTEDQVNFNLGSTRGDEATVPTAGGFTAEGCLNIEANLVLLMDITDITTLGVITAKTQAWPGVVDYTNTAMTPLVISNTSAGMSYFGCQPIILDDASLAFCITALSNGTGSLPAGKYILIIKPDLSTSGWLTDEMSNTYGLFASSTWLSNGINYQASRPSSLPTITIYSVTYNFSTGQTAVILGSGDVSSDAANAFGVLGDPNTGATFFTKAGIFGIDSVSGDDTGCWYCALDCSAFGQVTFVMPDASLGPSSSPTVWNNFNSTLIYGTYPQVDNDGVWWWIRLPLCDVSGNIVLEALTSEVYASVAVPPSVIEAWLVIKEPSLGLTDRSGYLFKSMGVQHSWTEEIRQRGQATVDLDIPAGDAYSPTRLTQLFLYDQTAAGFSRVFSGIIQDIEDKWLDNAGNRRLVVTAMSMESVFDTVYADPVQYVDQTCGAILTDIFNRYETGCPVTLGTVSAGVVIPLFNTKKGDRVSDLFTQLATTSLFTWGVNPVDLKLNFRDPSTNAAPFTLTSDDILWDSPNWKVRGADFRNRQGTRVNFEAFPHSMEFFQVSGGQQSFTLRNPVNQVVKCFVTLSTPNTATGTFTGQPSPGDTVTIGPLAAPWVANHAYALGGQIVVGGFVQEVTTAGTSGATQPTFGTATGDTTADFTVVWTCRGASGFSTGTYVYTFVTALDNTLFGQVLIGATVADTCLNLANAINAAPEVRRFTISLPTWESSQCNAVNIGSTSFTLQQKVAGSLPIAAISAIGTAFSWSSAYTSGGTSPQGSVGPNQGATTSLGVYASGTSSAPNSLIYTEGSRDVFLSTPLPVTPVGLNIEYTRVDGDTIEVEDSALVAATALLTGGTGLYEAFTDQSTTGLISTSAAAALQLVQQALQAFKVAPASFRFDTFRPGLRTASTLPVSIVKPNGASSLLNGLWVVESLEVSLIEPAKVPYLTPELGHYRYSVSCININQIGSWLDFWNGKSGGGGGSSSLVATSGGALNPTSGFPLDMSGSTISGKTFSAGDGFSYDLSSFLNCTAVGCTFTGRFFGAIFKNADLQNSNFTGDFEGCDFSNATLDGCTFSGRFLNCIFVSASGTGMTGSDSNFTGSDFKDATWSGDFHDSIFAGVNVPDAIFDGANFQGTKWPGVVFKDSDMSSVDFSNGGGKPAELTGTSWNQNALILTDFTGANMAGASFFQTGSVGSPPVFTGCNLTGVRFNDMVGNGYQLVKSIVASYTVKSWDANKVISASGAGITISLLDPVVSDTWQIAVLNADTTNGVTVDPGTRTINGVAGTVTIAPGAGLKIFSDGTNYFAF